MAVRSPSIPGRPHHDRRVTCGRDAVGAASYIARLIKRMALMLDTPTALDAQVPTLSLADQARDPDGFAKAFGESFERFGFAIVADHGIPQDLIDRAWSETEALFALPEAEKRDYFVAGGGGARGGVLGYCSTFFKHRFCSRKKTRQ